MSAKVVEVERPDWTPSLSIQPSALLSRPEPGSHERELDWRGVVVSRPDVIATALLRDAPVAFANTAIESGGFDADQCRVPDGQFADWNLVVHGESAFESRTEPRSITDYEMGEARVSELSATIVAPRQTNPVVQFHCHVAMIAPTTPSVNVAAKRPGAGPIMSPRIATALPRLADVPLVLRNILREYGNAPSLRARLASVEQCAVDDVIVVGLFGRVPIAVAARLALDEESETLRVWLKPAVLQEGALGGSAPSSRTVTLVLGRRLSSGRLLQAAI